MHLQIWAPLDGPDTAGTVLAESLARQYIFNNSSRLGPGRLGSSSTAAPRLHLNKANDSCHVHSFAYIAVRPTGFIFVVAESGVVVVGSVADTPYSSLYGVHAAYRIPVEVSYNTRPSAKRASALLGAFLLPENILRLVLKVLDVWTCVTDFWVGTKSHTGAQTLPQRPGDLPEAGDSKGSHPRGLSR